jgi:hypothetical protein
MSFSKRRSTKRLSNITKKYVYTTKYIINNLKNHKEKKIIKNYKKKKNLKLKTKKT